VIGRNPSEPITTDAHPVEASRSPFAIAHGELRRALVEGIGRRTGKVMEPVSLEEACVDVPLAELYRRKLRPTGFSGFVERIFFRWWR
jgi:hypothetical protein